jgi:hypothetical protein
LADELTCDVGSRAVQNVERTPRAKRIHRKDFSGVEGEKELDSVSLENIFGPLAVIKETKAVNPRLHQDQRIN